LQVRAFVPSSASQAGAPQITQFEVVVNWLEELKQRAPTR
jgi:hypothetical protein